MSVSQNALMIGMTASLIPLLYSILAGWTQSPSAALQRRSALALVITVIAMATTLLISGIWQAVEGSYLLTGACALGTAAMIAGSQLARTQLQVTTHLATTGETLKLTAVDRKRDQRLVWMMTIFAIVALLLVITNIILSVVRG